ncbi:multiheme c-type cytochrome [Armatimonas rosea]|uniref:Cytochrome c-552/4 domain-containing protein n=1 Tax=Armatimonas rosea TaxID=685828 RepID=A0A7W9W853_ARMRO|nr:multiheme c-type cytochrome [Armatimonas rosea]MBB6052383.1 hypothetical protein [Armatimonas rosea]
MMPPRTLVPAALLPLIVLWVAACTPTTPKSETAPSPAPTPNTAQFLGNDACKPCHAAEFKSHTNTRHMQTLRKATQSELGALAPPAGPLPGESALAWEKGQLNVVAPAQQTNMTLAAPLDLALGSGKTGITFLAVDSEGSLELRHSYFPHTKQWIVTPGQEKFEATSVGWIHPKDDSQRCVGCHAVVLPPDSLMPERKFFGVGCESCHGPGSEHVAAMQKGDKSKGVLLTALRGTGGKRLNEVCGRCHRAPADVEHMDELSKQATSRFMPYGLSLSQCFKQSNDKLSCVTCHNPHEDASTDTKRYEAVCVSCHAAPKKACPVNPKEKCVSCHMPTAKVFPGTSFPIKMADHFIRIYKDGKPTR